MGTITSLKLEHVGQIDCADVTFGELTVLVGPQATGKSVFLQFLKLALDAGYIRDQLHKYGIIWTGLREFLDVYLGEGMQGLWRGKGARLYSVIKVDGQRRFLKDLTALRGPAKEPTAFYIPAQRVLSLANSWPRPFTGFGSQDPFVVRDFSETFRLLMDREFGPSEELFPKSNRLKGEYRDLLSQNVFRGFGLEVDRLGAQKRLVLKKDASSTSIPFMAWSAGQREFVPLLMGLYWLLPPAGMKRRGKLKWVIIEELEMGLHPSAISVVLLLMMELLWRGYRVCLSTHSPHVLDVVWALRTIQGHGRDPRKLLEVFEAKPSVPMVKVANAVMNKEAKVYFFDRGGTTHDISSLDPGSDDASEAGWGGLSEFSGRIADIIATVVNESER